MSAGAPLQALAQELQIAEFVSIERDVSFGRKAELLGTARVGIHTMWDEVLPRAPVLAQSALVPRAPQYTPLSTVAVLVFGTAHVPPSASQKPPNGSGKKLATPTSYRK